MQQSIMKIMVKIYFIKCTVEKRCVRSKLEAFIQILQMFIIWCNDNLSKISGKLERVP